MNKLNPLKSNSPEKINHKQGNHRGREVETANKLSLVIDSFIDSYKGFINNKTGLRKSIQLGDFASRTVNNSCSAEFLELVRCFQSCDNPTISCKQSSVTFHFNKLESLPFNISRKADRFLTILFLKRLFASDTFWKDHLDLLNEEFNAVITYLLLEPGHPFDTDHLVEYILCRIPKLFESIINDKKNLFRLEIISTPKTHAKEKRRSSRSARTRSIHNLTNLLQTIALYAQPVFLENVITAMTPLLSTDYYDFINNVLQVITEEQIALSLNSHSMAILSEYLFSTKSNLFPDYLQTTKAQFIKILKQSTPLQQGL